MDYISTRGMSPAVDSAQAVLNGLAPDGGLYVPKSIPAFDWQGCLQKSSQGMSEMILSARTFRIWVNWSRGPTPANSRPKT